MKTLTFNNVGQRISKKFREKGKFSLSELMLPISRLTDNLIPLGLEKLVKLLEHVNMLATIAPMGSHSTKEPIYFMPCILKSARASELCVPTCCDSDPAPLMLRFDCGYVPVGVFPAMITNLMSRQRDWKMIEQGLYKNKVQFYAGTDYDKITLLSHPQYFVIVISRQDPEDFQTPTNSLCTHVQSVIRSTLRTVTSCMNYHFSMKYEFGFACPIHPQGDHLCVLDCETATARFMECLLNQQPVRLMACHTVWLPSKTAPPSASSTCGGI